MGKKTIRVSHSIEQNERKNIVISLITTFEPITGTCNKYNTDNKNGQENKMVQEGEKIETTEAMKRNNDEKLKLVTMEFESEKIEQMAKIV